MLQYMTKNNFNELLKGSNRNYYLGRWEYYKEVIKIIKKTDVENVLEIGPGFIPVIENAKLLLNPLDDQFGKPNINNVIYFDITNSNWPIKNKEFDLVIALQVWEHLDNKQTRAFKELKRISKSAILSFPYLWNGGIEDKPSHRAHRNIDKELISDWTLNTLPKKIIEIEKTGEEFSKGKRIIYYWEFKD